METAQIIVGGLIVYGAMFWAMPILAFAKRWKWWWCVAGFHVLFAASLTVLVCLDAFQQWLFRL